MERREYLSVPVDPATKAVIKRAARHGGLNTASFVRGVTLFFIEVNGLTDLMGRPPKKEEKRKYNPHRLPQSIGEILNEQDNG